MAQKKNKNTCVIWDYTTYPMTNLFLSAQQVPDNNFLIIRARCLHLV